MASVVPEANKEGAKDDHQRRRRKDYGAIVLSEELWRVLCGRRVHRELNGYRSLVARTVVQWEQQHENLG